MDTLVEKHVADFLAAELGVEAWAGVPAVRPETFISVERTGGSRVNRLDRPTLAIQAWAKSDGDASLLASNAAEALDERLGADGRCFVSSIGGPYSFRDPDSKTPRFQLTVGLVDRG